MLLQLRSPRIVGFDNSCLADDLRTLLVWARCRVDVTAHVVSLVLSQREGYYRRGW